MMLVKSRFLLIGMILVLALNVIGCGASESVLEDLDNENTELEGAKIEYELTEEGIIKPEFAKRIIETKAKTLVQAISERDAETIAKFVHPVKGLRFTPYTFVSLKEDLVFNKEEVKNFFNDERIYLWGNYDGIGDGIHLTPSEYYKEFIYSADFKNAEEIGYNEVLSSGNTVENQFEVYQNSIIVEYYFPGFVPEYGGIDWKGLRLVFEEYENDWRLIGIIHSQWTI